MPFVISWTTLAAIWFACCYLRYRIYRLLSRILPISDASSLWLSSIGRFLGAFLLHDFRALKPSSKTWKVYVMILSCFRVSTETASSSVRPSSVSSSRGATSRLAGCDDDLSYNVRRGGKPSAMLNPMGRPCSVQNNGKSPSTYPQVSHTQWHQTREITMNRLAELVTVVED